MAVCKRCGKQLDSDAVFCSGCGTKVTEEKASATNTGNILFDTPDATPTMTDWDIAQNKAMAIMAYLGVLVLIPIFVAKDSPFAKYHANQGLLSTICICAYTMTVGILSFILRLTAPMYSFIALFLGLGTFAVIGFAVIGIINAARGRAKELPFIGRFRILK